MRLIDRLRGRGAAEERSPYAVRPAGTTAAEAQAADQAAAASTEGSAGTTSNLTTGGPRVNSKLETYRGDFE